MASLPGDGAVLASLRSRRAARGQIKLPRRPGKSGAFPPESERQRDVRGGRPGPSNQGEGRDPPLSGAAKLAPRATQIPGLVRLAALESTQTSNLPSAEL